MGRVGPGDMVARRAGVLQLHRGQPGSEGARPPPMVQGTFRGLSDRTESGDSGSAVRPRAATAAACLTPTWNPSEPLRQYGAKAETKAGILPPGSGICAAWLICWWVEWVCGGAGGTRPTCAWAILWISGALRRTKRIGC